MDPQTVFCPHLDCAARGQVGKGKIGVHSRKEHRYICPVCHKTFAETTGTVFYRWQKAKDLMTLILTLLAYGCPLHAVVVAFGLDERTVKSWLTTAGQHCEHVHEHLVQQPRDLGHVQADEIRAKLQNAVVWLAMALQVSTRLWLGGVARPQRDEALLTELIQRVRQCALCRPLRFCIDGWRADIPASQKVFREAIPTGRLGRPHLRPWDQICIAQMVKHYAQGHVVGVVRRIIQGTSDPVEQLLYQTHGGHLINTAYIERLNATFVHAWRIWCGAVVVWRGRTPRCNMVCIGLERSTTFVRIIRVCGCKASSVDTNGYRERQRWQRALRIIAGRCANCCRIGSPSLDGSRPNNGDICPRRQNNLFFSGAPDHD